MKKQSVVGDKYVTIIFISWGLILFGLYLTSLYSYLLFHSLAEIFSIVVACGIFMLAWNSRRFLDNTYLLFIGIAYLFIGSLDLIHTLAYQGMGVFQGYGTNLPTQLWIASRYVESLSLLIAPLFFGRKLKTNFLFLGYVLAVSLLLGSIFYWNLFPVCFIEGVGLTLFKKVSEYIISLILFVSIAMLFKKRREFDTSVLRLLIASIILTIVSELAFTFYVHAYGLSNLIGHYLKIVSFYLIYKAIIETGLAKPYALLFRNLKQSEEALLAEKQFTDDVIEALTDTFYIFDPEDGKGLRWNKVLEEMSGYNYNDMRHYPPTHFYPPEEHQRIEEATKTIREKGSATVELTYITKDGRRTPFEYSAVLIKSPEAKPWICAIGRDITERKRAEAQIIRAKQEWERTFDAVPDLIMILNNEYRVVRVNKAMAERAGCNPRDLVGQTCYDVFHGTEKPVGLCPHARLMADGFAHSAEVHEDRLGGDFLVSVNPLHGADGKLTGSVHVARDITRRKQAENALRRAHDELEQRVEERTAELKREIQERKQAEESLRESENHLRHLSSQLLTAQENERKRIALELHDGIGNRTGTS
jgi:PAS domain S-box-containing protein